MVDSGIEKGDYAALESYYITRLTDIVSKIGNSYIVWQEPFDNGVKVELHTVADLIFMSLHLPVTSPLSLSPSIPLLSSAPLSLSFTLCSSLSSHFILDHSHHTLHINTELLAVVQGHCSKCLEGESRPQP